MKKTYFISILLSLCLFTNFTFSKNIIFENNKRLSFNDIDNLTSYDLKSSVLNDSDINNIIKDLVSSDLITNLSINIDNNHYYLNIEEAIFINQIFINGNIKLKDLDIIDNISISEKNFITENLMFLNIDRIQNLYSSIGQQNVLVNFYLEEFANNSFNLIYDIKENYEKYLNNISFDGNSFYSSDYLKSIISIKEKKFFTLLSQSNFITENKITNAINNISKLYKDFGFFDIKINFTVKEFKNKIHLSLFIEEGERYFVNNINYLFENDNIESLFFNEKIILTNLLKDNPFNKYTIDNHLNIFDNLLFSNNYSNYKVDYSYNNFSIDFFLLETSPLTVNKISFFGNKVTKDSTLRRQVYIKPGDIYNPRLSDKSIKNMIRRPYLDNVTLTTNISNNESIDLDFNVTEKIQSGSFKLGAGYSAQGGLSTAVGLSDSNFIGSGNKASADLSFSNNSVLFDLTYQKFYLGNYFIDNSYRIYNSQDDLLNTYGYKRDSYGLDFSLKFPIDYDLLQNEYYSLGLGYDVSNTFDLKNGVSNSVIQNSGKSKNFYIKNSYVNDKTNQVFNPTSGSFHNITFSLSPPNISDDDFLKIIFNNNYYFNKNITNNTFFLLSSFGLASGLSSKIKTKDAFSLGGDFKGFQYSGIGPRDSAYNYLGGTKMYQLTTGFSKPVLFDNKDTLIIKYFATVGSIFDSEYTSSFNSETPNASIGVSADIMTAIGPLSFSLAKPLIKNHFDKIQTFDFSIGTAF